MATHRKSAKMNKKQQEHCSKCEIITIAAIVFSRLLKRRAYLDFFDIFQTAAQFLQGVLYGIVVELDFAEGDNFSNQPNNLASKRENF